MDGARSDVLVPLAWNPVSAVLDRQQTSMSAAVKKQRWSTVRPETVSGQVSALREGVASRAIPPANFQSRFLRLPSTLYLFRPSGREASLVLTRVTAAHRDGGARKTGRQRQILSG